MNMSFFNKNTIEKARRKIEPMAVSTFKAAGQTSLKAGKNVLAITREYAHKEMEKRSLEKAAKHEIDEREKMKAYAEERRRHYRKEFKL